MQRGLSVSPQTHPTGAPRSGAMWTATPATAPSSEFHVSHEFPLLDNLFYSYGTCGVDQPVCYTRRTPDQQTPDRSALTRLSLALDRTTTTITFPPIWARDGTSAWACRAVCTRDITSATPPVRCTRAGMSQGAFTSTTPSRGRATLWTTYAI
eukprot:scaffold72530_cov64-Phaeocystis_antarctica.AAC.8